MNDVAAEECEALNRPPVFETYPVRHTALGKLQISRALPVRGRRLIGPWCFLDRYGPLTFSGAKPMDVAPHPHIGLQTVSWLLEGEILHRDSIGSEATVTAGGVNVMTSGRGIAHSEETPSRNGGRLSGVQLWIALPEADRDVEPAFHAIERVPAIESRGGISRIFMGEIQNVRSAAPAYSDVIGVDSTVHRGETLTLPAVRAREHGVMLLEGDARFEGNPLQHDVIHYLGCGRTELAFDTSAGARLLLVGGVPFGEQVLMWWNFVARTREEIATAREAWQRGELGEVPSYPGPRIEAPPLALVSPPNPAS